MPLTIKTYIDIAIGLVVVALIVIVGFLYDRHKIDSLRLDAADKARAQLQQGLDSLQQGQAADRAAIESMAASQAQVAQHGSVVRQRVTTMEAGNAAIHDVLSVALPAGGCMLDDTCPGGAVPAAVSGASAAVH